LKTKSFFYEIFNDLKADDEAIKNQFISKLFEKCGSNPPTFDLTLLGLGDDGHTASLFPYKKNNNVDDFVIFNEGKGLKRISLTPKVLSASSKIVFLVSGANKRIALERLLDEKESLDRTPSKLIKSVPDAKIILYNFEKLCGYKFSVECVENLAARFPKNIIGVKDSSYNLMGNLNIKNFSILPGSELKLLNGLKKDCSGIITATCNVTAKLARKVFDDFEQNKEQTVNDKLCEVRKAFDQFNLISGLHSFLSLTDKQFLNILPTCSLLNKQDEKILIDKLKDLDFLGKDFKAA